MKNLLKKQCNNNFDIILKPARWFFLLWFGVFAFFPNIIYAQEMTAYPRVKLQTLDKATARTGTFEARVGETIKSGLLYIKVQACKKSSPIDKPESTAFIQIWEMSKEEAKPEWVFSGWMFASSPALSPMDHPIYDVWLLDCLPEVGQEPPQAAEAAATPANNNASATPSPQIQEEENPVETEEEPLD